jgi:hypothetical protein
MDNDDFFTGAATAFITCSIMKTVTPIRPDPENQFDGVLNFRLLSPENVSSRRIKYGRMARARQFPGVSVRATRLLAGRSLLNPDSETAKAQGAYGPGSAADTILPVRTAVAGVFQDGHTRRAAQAGSLANAPQGYFVGWSGNTSPWKMTRPASAG